MYHRRSPLVQGGLEPVGVCRDGTNWPQNEALVQERLSMVKFEHVTATILREIEDPGSEMELERRS